MTGDHHSEFRKVTPSIYWRFIVFVLSAMSIASLLGYFHGWTELANGVKYLHVPAALALMTLTWWASNNDGPLFDLVASGFVAGLVATAAYDLVRAPLVHYELPVFKAISYFGTIICNQERPSLPSEITGWLYHVSNGVGFGLMYTALVPRQRWWSAVAWGLSLEVGMLLTPYAEVFGYTVSTKFLWITIGSHAVYGLALSATLRAYQSTSRDAPEFRRLVRGTMAGVAVLVIFGIAIDFHRLHVEKIPASPPPYIGPELYTTWDVLETDRVLAMWIFTRFVNEHARFHLIEPFSRYQFGTPFDIPEAKVRRIGAKSATQVLTETYDIPETAATSLLIQTAHLHEIAPWRVNSSPNARELGSQIRDAVNEDSSNSARLASAFRFLDMWYSATTAE